MASENAAARQVRKVEPVVEPVEVVDAKPCPNETYGVNPQVSACAKAAKPSPNECTQNQLLEIVIGVARRFRTAKEDVTIHKEYILRLKNDVFKVSFGSLGVHVAVEHRTKGGGFTTEKMRWKEFCKTQFGVSADWVNRICGEKAENGRRRPQSEKPLFKKGYQAGRAELHPKLKAAAEREAALGKRIAELEGDNQRLRGIADCVQQQFQEGVNQATASLPPQDENLKELAKLAAEAFRIVNGRFGERLMGSPEGNRLVEIARQAAAIKGRIKVC